MDRDVHSHAKVLMEHEQGFLCSFLACRFGGKAESHLAQLLKRRDADEEEQKRHSGYDFPSFSEIQSQSM